MRIMLSVFLCSTNLPEWFPIRSRHVQKFLADLKVDKATGPDGLSALFLQKLSKVLSLPLAILIRRIFNESKWPSQWRLHHIIQLFKRGSAFLPGQYRGIHLTSVLSKVVERVIGNPLTAFLEARGYGEAQWAFRKKSSARDLITICGAMWSLLICQGFKIGLYLSDISGAFDKVSRALIIGKLSQLGLPGTFLDFLNDYLLTREGSVREEGADSKAMALANMVFQGTVLGPCLWNVFFADVVQFVPSGSQRNSLFADDLTVMCHKAQDAADSIVVDELHEMHIRTHEWGKENQVQFDPSQEYTKIINPSRRVGDDFKMLDTLFDTKLKMLSCLESVLTGIRPKIRAVLRLRDLYIVSSIFN